jgi:hypothetical protein
MLSPGDPTTLKNIDRRSWELEAHALSIAPTVGRMAEALGYLGGSARVICAGRYRAVGRPSGPLGATAPIISTAPVQDPGRSDELRVPQTYHAFAFEPPVNR